MVTTKRRLRADERRKQIVEVTLQTIAKYGVHGTTVVRIAEGAGIVHSALYAHFQNRQEILLAALDEVFDKIYEIHRACRRDDALEWLREIMRYQTTYLSTSSTPAYTLPLFEFIVASPEEGLHDALRERESEATRRLAVIIDEAKRQGSVRQSVDSEETAWMLVSCAWAAESAYLMNIDLFQSRSIALKMVDLIFDQIVTPDSGRLAQKLSPR